jgi:hypothetical protein
MLILAFGNKARHGKDTAGEAVVNHFIFQRSILQRHYGAKQVRPAAMLYKFADALYKECRELHGMTEKDSPLLQRVGTARRYENYDYWADKCFAQIDREQPDVAVITDIRYKNEARGVKARGGFIINVSRMNPDGTPYVDPSRDATHSSEVDLDDYLFDHFIKAYTGEVALIQEQAITIAEYARGLKS